MITNPPVCPHCGKQEPWRIPIPDADQLKFDCCLVAVPLTPKDYILKFGKYVGSTLDEVNDEWYLKFLAGVAKEKEDWVLERCLAIKAKK
jgi:hypothetical protein